ncbi:MAG TPA: heparinase II/III family protein [Planctomycetota bacterium]|nr:heparinase II/III family protein [Planctomycetota bacterium]
MGSEKPTQFEDPDLGPGGSRALRLDLEEITPAGDAVALLGQTVRFAVHLGPEHHPENVRFEWFLDGAPLTVSEPELFLDTSGEAPGVRLVQAVVREEEADDREAWLSWRLQLHQGSIENRPPRIEQAFPPSGRPVPRGELIPFSVVASDVDAGDSLGFEWTLDGRRLEETGPDVVIDTSGLARGPHVVLVEVTDGVSRPREAFPRFAWVLEVELESAHSRPYLVRAWPAGRPRIPSNGKLRFEVEAELPDREDLVSYHWEVDGIPQPVTESVFHFEPPSAEESDFTAGSHRVTCRLVDGIEETGETGDPIGWTVHRGPVAGPTTRSGAPGPNSPPILVSRIPAAGMSIIPGESRVFRVEVEDADGDILTYRWLVDGQPQLGEGPSFTYTASPGKTRPLRVEVEVTDGGTWAPGAELGFGPVLGSWDLKRAQVVSLALTLADDSHILDNSGDGTASTGNWLMSGAGGSYGSSSLYSKSTGAAYTYAFTLPNPGSYEVLLWWTSMSSRSSSVPVSIEHAGGTAKRTVNQTSSGGKWNSLGTFDFIASAKVVITSTSGTSSTCADAVCLNPVSGSSSSSGSESAAQGASEIVIEDGAAGTSFQGVWTKSSAPDPHGVRSLYARGSGHYTFQRAISSPGTYDVYAWWTQWPTRDGAVPFDVVHSSGTSTVKKDQRAGGGTWHLLGRYSFSSLLKVTVRVPGSTTVCADAVRFVPAGSSPPPPPPDQGSIQSGDIVRDNGGPGTSSDGSWSRSSAPNAYGKDSLYAKDRGSYVYDVALAKPGKYGVFAWYTQWPSRESATPYEVRHASGTGIVMLDQRTGGGKWHFLGDYTFDSRARVTIRVVDSNTVSADAIRLVPGGTGTGDDDDDPPPPPAAPAPPPSSPQITELAAFPLSPTLARVSWRTNYLGTSVVSFGLTSSANSSRRTVSGTRWNHSVILDSLSENRLYHVRVESVGSGVSRTSATVSFRTPDASPSYTVTSSHPRIFFTKADIPAIRQRIQTAPFNSWWGSVKSFAAQHGAKSISSQRDDQPEYNQTLAFAGLIGDVASYRNTAISVSMAVAALSDTGDNREMRRRVDLMFPVYDWLHDHLSASQKTTLRSALGKLAKHMEARVQETEYADGHSNGDQNGAFLAALAIHGEDPDAAKIVERAMVRYNFGFWPFWREHGSENGGTFKGAWYTTVATQFNYEVFAAWKSATGRNLYQVEKAWFERLADVYLHSSLGDHSWFRSGDVVFQQGFDEVEKFILIQIASEYRNTDAQWLAEKLRDYLGTWGPHMVLEILWYDPSVPARVPVQPTSRHFKGSGLVFMRESWQDNAVRASFRAMPYYMAGHNHLDQCSFEIFYKEPLALDSGIYDTFGSSHQLNYYSRTIAHNAILVTDPGEVFKLYRVAYAADGGQCWLDPSRASSPFPETIKDLTHDDSFHIGGVRAHEDTDLYTYTVGDGTAAYNSNKLASYFRHFLWLKSPSGWNHPVIAVFDEVESTKSSFKKTYLLHTSEKPVLSGTLASAKSGAGLLYQRTVFPQSPQIKLVGGSGYEYFVNGRNYRPNRPPKSGEAPGSWRMEVSPSSPRIHDEFLHLLYPTEAGRSAPPSVRAIDAASMKGFEAQDLVVLFAVKLENVTSVTYNLSASRRNLLFGLTPGRPYDVHIDGTRVATPTATVNGTLQFVSSGPGKIEVVRR